MLTQMRGHQVVTSRRSRMTSLLVAPAYVILALLFVWMVQLQAEFRSSARGGDSHNIEKGLDNAVPRRAKRSMDSSPNTFLNMLPGAGHNNLLYDMELEPCGGAVFTVWGRSVCPEETQTELVYAGVVGGTNIDTPGGGVDYLCLSRHPQWRTTSSGPPQSSVVYNDNTRQDDNAQSSDKPCSSSTTTSPVTSSDTTPPSVTSYPDETGTSDNFHLISGNELLRLLMGTLGTNQVTPASTTKPPTSTNPAYSTRASHDAYLYGAEFQGSHLHFGRDNLEADTFVDQDAVCAVCRSKVRLSAVMIPGRRECYSGWTKEYDGFLMSGPVGAQAQHRFVCVHSAPEAAQGGFRRERGAVFYHVRAMCGSLPCPTYIQDRELTCVVCTK